MGLLDDAIREHLELKRRRGADPDEVAQAEREALGPVRREPIEPRDQVLSDQIRHAESEAGYDHDDVIQPQGYIGADESPGPAGLPDDRFLASAERESGGLSESEYEEYYDEEYHDEEREEGLEEPFDGGAAVDRRYELDLNQPSPEPAQPSRTSSTGAHRARIPPESAPPTQATSPEPGDAELDEVTDEYTLEEGRIARRKYRPVRGDSEAERAEPQGEDVLEETPEFLQDAPEHDRLWFEQRPPRDFDFDG
jgi:hypothetical protein